MRKPRLPVGFDWVYLIVPVLLVAAGLAVIYSLASADGERSAQALSQGIYALVGLAMFGVVSSVDYRIFRAGAPILYGATILLLILVFVFGDEQFGAKRWLDFGPIQLQPAELMKLGLIAVVAWIFLSREEIRLREIVIAISLIGMALFMIMTQPDFGSAIVVVSGTIPIFILSRIHRTHIMGLLMTAALIIPLLFATLKPYQQARLTAFFNPAQDPFGAGYNVTQATIAIGQGGLFGRGLGQGSQSTLQFVPVAHTDFIFAGLAEAVGFIGSVIVLGLFAVLIWRAFHLAIVTQDKFGRLMASGIAAVWLTSVFINVGMNLGLVPVTGIPLPFVSHGGSSLITNFVLVGILESINLRKMRISFRSR